MSHAHRIVRAAVAVGVIVAAVGSLLAVGAAPAGAHAIVELQDVDAVVGRTSAMTLEIQHGCITGGGGTVGVVATFGTPFGAVTAGAVPGWTAAVAPGASGGSAASGPTVTWTTTGAAQPFSTPLYLPLTVRWPSRPGAYGIAVSQTCSDPTEETVWETPIQPATVGVPSPPVTPLATVCVLPKRLAQAESAQRERAVQRICATVR
ncbi:MAG: hypothetical protein ACKOA9_12405 [Actinomycetota bacterium]